MYPPNSPTNLPPGFNALLTLSRTPAGDRLHQCRVADVNTTSNLCCSSGGTARSCASPWNSLFCKSGKFVAALSSWTRRIWKVFSRGSTIIEFREVPFCHCCRYPRPRPLLRGGQPACVSALHCRSLCRGLLLPFEHSVAKVQTQCSHPSRRMTHC